MSDKVEYEPVPESDLHEYQRFHVNKAKTSDVEPYQGGIAAEVLGIPAIAGAKTVQGVMKSNALKLAKDAIEKIAAPKPPVPTTVSEFHAPNMVSEHGFGPGAMKNVAHNVDMARVNQLQADLAANPEKGFAFEGNRRVLTPQAKPWELPEVTSTAGAPSAPATPALTPTQRALQVVKGTAQNPIVSGTLKGAGTVGGLWEGGENLVRLWNHFKQDKPGRELLDVAGVVSNAATLLPTPASPWSNIAGAAASIPIGMYQRHLDEQDTAQKKATGGLVYLR